MRESFLLFHTVPLGTRFSFGATTVCEPEPSYEPDDRYMQKVQRAKSSTLLHDII